MFSSSLHLDSNFSRVIFMRLKCLLKKNFFLCKNKKFSDILRLNLLDVKTN